MRLKLTPWMMPGCFIGYVVLACLLAQVLSFKVPYFIEALISIFIAPLFFIFIPLYPLLKRLGLFTSGWWQGPSTGGLILGTAIYAILLYLVGLFAIWILKRTS